MKKLLGLFCIALLGQIAYPAQNNYYRNQQYQNQQGVPSQSTQMDLFRRYAAVFESLLGNFNALNQAFQNQNPPLSNYRGYYQNSGNYSSGSSR